MSRRALLLVALGLCGAAALAWVALSDHAKHVPRIAVIYPAGGPLQPGGALDQFRQGLAEAGYVEGQSIVVDVYYEDGNPANLATRLSTWAKAPVDVIVAGTTLSARAAKVATETIPIVFAVSVDPVGDRIVASLAKPGGNATGLSIMSSEIEGKRFALLKSAVPNLSRVALMVDSGNALWETYVAMAQAAAQAVGIATFVVAVQKPEDFPAAVASAKRSGAQALLVPTTVMFAANGSYLAQVALEHDLPSMLGSGDARFARAGGLMNYGASIPGSWRRAATFVDRILRGEKPANMAVEQPTHFELTINLATAARLDLTLPPSLLVQADEVIK